MGAALTDLDALDGSATYRTGLPGALVSAEMILKIAATVNPINTGAIATDAFFKNCPDGRKQFCTLLSSEIACDSQRMQLGQVQGFVSIYIAQPGQEGLVEQQGFELPAMGNKHLVKYLWGKLWIERFRPQVSQDLLRILYQPDLPEFPGVVEGQPPAIFERYDHPVVRL